ncbi:MAG: DUF72 domain-containing protein [Burkholderiales bacterium]|jgi:uncharacterized protein YecE (DUF72 family)
MPGRSARGPEGEPLPLFDDLPEPAPLPARRGGTRGDAPVGTAARPLDLPPALEPYRGLLRLGTSSWSFPGWQGLVWDTPPAPYAEGRLSREGLPAYAAHPLLSAVGIDRGFYAPVGVDEYRRYASQVPDGFRFLVKAPGAVTDALRRDEHGRGREPNPGFLDARAAIDTFVGPAVDGLGDRLGTLLFQFSPLPAATLADAPAWIASLHRFLDGLPRPLPAGSGYAVELRDPSLLTPRLIDMLREAGVDYCVGLHDRMPPVERQLRALARLHGDAPGPLVARWTLHAGLGYEQAKHRYAPFDALVDPDPATRDPLAAHAAATLRAGQPVTVIANNKAEGSAPRTLSLLAQAIAAMLGD